MNKDERELLLDCLSYLWTLSKRAEDYWMQVASLEREESLSYFSSLVQHPTQMGALFSQLSKEEHEKIYHSLQVITQRAASVRPGFFEISLWATIIDVRSTAMRKEFFRMSLALDALSRRLVGAPSELNDSDLIHYLDLAKKYISLSKHIHPAFSHSDHAPNPVSKKELATG